MDHADTNTGAAAEVASPYLTIEEAAAYCRLSVQTLYTTRCRTGQPASVAPAVGKLLFTRQSLDQWLSSRGKKRGRPRKGGAK